MEETVCSLTNCKHQGAGCPGYAQYMEPLLIPATDFPHLPSIPIYTVGPATAHALSLIPAPTSLSIHGAHTGNGGALAKSILEHYPALYPSHTPAPPLLFLVGDQRRDIIPKTLMDPNLPAGKRVQVDELVVYGTDVMASFPGHFDQVLTVTEPTAIGSVRWVVVFSPTGCAAMLSALNLLDPATGRAKTGERGGGCGVRKGRRSTYIATIGPTTRDYLRREFGFEADVCAEKPTPEGVGDGIIRYMKEVKFV